MNAVEQSEAKQPCCKHPGFRSEDTVKVNVKIKANITAPSASGWFSGTAFCQFGGYKPPVLAWENVLLFLRCFYQIVRRAVYAVQTLLSA